MTTRSNKTGKTNIISKTEARKRIKEVERQLSQGAKPPGSKARAPSATARAADFLGLHRKTLDDSLKAIQREYGLVPNWDLFTGPKKTVDLVRQLVIRRDVTVNELKEKTGKPFEELEKSIRQLQREGLNLHQFGDTLSVVKDLIPSHLEGPHYRFTSNKNNEFKFGALGDNHLGSKYARLDVLNGLYDIYEEEGVKTVFNTGNWIDGEARFNKHDLLVHGMDRQLAYLAEHYPQRKGIKTYAVAGDDHEGWYAQREGVNIGRHAENTMRDAGRKDWLDLGYMEAIVELVNYNSGKVSILAVVHPGGGSSYALSYAIQKIIESLDGGEKPAVGLYGHYHKLWSGNLRNVWVVQTGTTQDQTPFMRKKKLEAHVGGAFVSMKQDPETGAIVRFKPELIRYFNKGYYNNRWSHSDAVVLPARSVIG